MNTKKIIFLALLCVQAKTGICQWNLNPRINTPVCTNTAGQFSVQVCSDGKGGSLMVWQDNRNGDYDIYAQYFNAAGVAQWPVDGLLICGAKANQTEPKVTLGNDGEFLFTWTDDRNPPVNVSPNIDIYAQKVSTAGQLRWRLTGVPVCTQTSPQYDPVIATDGNGGAIICWTDNRGSVLYDDLYSQRIAATGQPVWQRNGVPVCAAADNQFVPCIVSDNAGGAIIAWIDRRNGNFVPDKIYAQRIAGNGVVKWATDGNLICDKCEIPFEPEMITDGNGGAVYVWQDSRNSTNDIYAQRILPNGTNAWAMEGLAVCTSDGDQSLPVVDGNISGGFILAWEDKRNNASKKDIYAQKINANGLALWPANGIAVCLETKDQQTPVVAAGDNGGALVAWVDKRSNNPNVFAAFINSNGTVQPGSKGVPVSIVNNEQILPQISKSFNGRAVLTWWDYRAGLEDANIYATILSSNKTDNSRYLYTDVLNDFTLLTNTPNPVSGKTTIRFMAENAAAYKNAVIIIKNSAGQEISRVTIKVNDGLNTTTYTPPANIKGLLFYSLEVNGVTVDTKQMFIAE